MIQCVWIPYILGSYASVNYWQTKFKSQDSIVPIWISLLSFIQSVHYWFEWPNEAPDVRLPKDDLYFSHVRRALWPKSCISQLISYCQSENILAQTIVYITGPWGAGWERKQLMFSTLYKKKKTLPSRTLFNTITIF